MHLTLIQKDIDVSGQREQTQERGWWRRWRNWTVWMLLFQTKVGKVDENGLQILVLINATVKWKLNPF